VIASLQRIAGLNITEESGSLKGPIGLIYNPKIERTGYHRDPAHVLSSERLVYILRLRYCRDGIAHTRARSNLFDRDYILI
jgi:hypothetical protein